MNSFPGFMKRETNKIPTCSQNTADIKGYYYEAADGSQMAFWESYSDRISKKHTHDFDEYMICVSGQYIACFADKEITLNPGDELVIPEGTEQWGRSIAGTRTIHAFGGKRIQS
jgi:quercetin dioxygenase-like cupin family protein